MSFKNMTYSVPQKSRGKYVSFPVKCDDLYVNESEERGGLDKRTEPASSNSRTPLIPSEDSTMSANNNGNNLNLNNSLDVEIVGISLSETNNNGIPPVPHKKPSTRVFHKMDKVEMNPMPSPRNKTMQFQSTSDQINTMPDLDNFHNTGYLTPSDHPPYADTNFRFSNGENQMSTSPVILKKNGRQFQRFDSGVGDCDSDRGSSIHFSASPSMSSRGSMSNPRLSTQYEQTYEDIDEYHKAHQLKKQPPKPRSSTDKLSPMDLPPVPNGLRPLPPVNIAGVTQTDSEDYENDMHMNTSIAETISSPCCSTKNSTLPHTYTPLNISSPVVMQKPPAKSESCSCGLVIALIIILIISVAALGLSIYILVSRPDTTEPPVPQALSVGTQTNFSESTIPLLEQALAPLKEEIAYLKQENARLKDMLVAQEENFTSNIEPLKEEVVQLSSLQSNLSQFVEAMEMKFDAEIANISLTPGAQGPPGVANFSLCKFETIIGSAPADDIFTTNTVYLPSEQDAQKYFATFAYCTYDGANQSALEAMLDSASSSYRYRCKCWGHVGKSHTACTLHLWMCPRLQ